MTNEKNIGATDCVESANADVVLSANSLCKRYRGLMAVNNVSLQIERGAIAGLIGKNGAGKTTLMRMILGLVPPTSGTFCVLPQSQRKSTSVAAIVESPSIYQDMCAMDNLRAQCILLGVAPDEEFLKMTLQLVNLVPTTQKAKNFSLGMKQRLALAMALVGRPELLVLDEPTNGLDPQGIAEMRSAFVNINRQLGVTILISSHILSELAKFATEYFIMDRGRIVQHATREQLQMLQEKQMVLTLPLEKVQQAEEVLQQFGKTQSRGNTVVLFGDVPATQIVLALAKEDIEVQNIATTEGDLEQYFLKLVGGNK